MASYTTFPTNETTQLLLYRYFATLPDPRYRRARRHSLMTILFIVLCATLSGADSFFQMAQWAHAKRAWLEKYVDLSGGIPSHDTLGRVFARLNAPTFATCFEAWTQALRQQQSDIIALDGKTIRGSLDEATGKPALHLISAFATSNRLVLCQREVEAGHENEISAAPDLLALLDLEGCTVTADALLCQKRLTSQITAQKGQYVLALKENHPHLYDTTQEFFTYWGGQDWKTEEDHIPIAHQFAQTVGKGHGRIERRRCFVAEATAVAPYLFSEEETKETKETKETWSNLRSIAAIESVRQERGKTTTHVRYFLTSIAGPKAASQILHAVREHWGIENRLHWCLDVVMGEDKHTLRGRTNARAAVRNMALLRKLALNLLRNGGDPDDSLRSKRYMAGWNTDYLQAILEGRKFTNEPNEQ